MGSFADRHLSAIFAQAVDWSLGYDVVIRQEVDRRTKVYLAALRSLELRAYLLRRVRQDFFFWRDNFCWTFDDDRGEIPYLPLAGHTELQRVFLGLDGARTPLGQLQNTLLYSSRKRGKTVAHVAPIVWDWLIEPSTKHYTITAQQQSQVDNNTFVFSAAVMPKVRCMAKWCPSWMRPEAWKPEWRQHRKGQASADRFLLLQNLDTGSSVRGATANVNRERGGRAKRNVIDEANFIPRLKDLLGSLTKVGPWSMVSSVRGRYTHFAKMAHGEVLDVIEPDGPGGVVVQQWHYSEHPLYDPETPGGALRIATERKTMTKEDWASEMENDFQQSIPGRIWGTDFDPELHIATPEETVEVLENLYGMEIVEGWDFGVSTALTAVVWCAFADATDTLYILGARQWKDGLVEQIARDVADEGWHSSVGGSREPDYRVGDRAGAAIGKRTQNGRKIALLRSWIDNLRSVEIDVREQFLPVEKAISKVRHKLRAGKIKLLPRACRKHPEEPESFPSVREVFEGYRRELKAGHEDVESANGEAPRPAKDIYSHLADAIQHAAWTIWAHER